MCYRRHDGCANFGLKYTFCGNKENEVMDLHLE